MQWCIVLSLEEESQRLFCLCACVWSELGVVTILMLLIITTMIMITAAKSISIIPIIYCVVIIFHSLGSMSQSAVNSSYSGACCFTIPIHFLECQGFLFWLDSFLNYRIEFLTNKSDQIWSQPTLKWFFLWVLLLSLKHDILTHASKCLQ